jgi:hypothetical protein
MTTFWLNLSVRVYAVLAQLYPAEHRAHYASAMIQLFADQCRDAQRHHGAWGIVGVWLRTLPDFFWTVFSEHWNAMDLRAELLNPDPTRRLPWKSVALVLAPGLVVCAGQLLSLSGDSWYFTVYRTLGFYLMIPVLIAWIWTRKFPLWGLLPLGMAINHLVTYPWYWRIINWLAEKSATLPAAVASTIEIIRNQGMVISDPTIEYNWQTLNLLTYVAYSLELMALTITSIFLIRRWRKGVDASRPLLWLQALLTVTIALLLAAAVGFTLYDAFGKDSTCLPTSLCSASLALSNLNDYLTEPVRFLFLLGLCAAFARRYGSWSVLLPLGYLLPAVIFGFGDVWEWDVLLTVAILGWRIGIAIIAPILVMRSVSLSMRRLAILLPLGFLFAIRLISTQLVWFYFGFSIDPWGITKLASDILLSFVIPFLFLALVVEISSAHKELNIQPQLSPMKVSTP